MAAASDRRIASPAWLIGGASLAAALMIYCLLPHSADSDQVSDSWRRTAAGWEHFESWPPAKWAGPVHGSQQLRSRYDSHPAALALAETLFVALGFYLFPTASKFKLAPRGNWQAWLARSFRASAFGC